MQSKALERSLKSILTHYRKQLLLWISFSSLEDRAELRSVILQIQTGEEML